MKYPVKNIKQKENKAFKANPKCFYPKPFEPKYFNSLGPNLNLLFSKKQVKKEKTFQAVKTFEEKEAEKNKIAAKNITVSNSNNETVAYAFANEIHNIKMKRYRERAREATHQESLNRTSPKVDITKPVATDFSKMNFEEIKEAILKHSETFVPQAPSVKGLVTNKMLKQLDNLSLDATPCELREMAEEFIETILDLKHCSKKALGYFISFIINVDMVIPSQETIAKSIGCKRGWANVIVSKLHELGLIKVHNRGFREINREKNICKSYTCLYVLGDKFKKFAKIIVEELGINHILVKKLINRFSCLRAYLGKKYTQLIINNKYRKDIYFRDQQRERIKTELENFKLKYEQCLGGKLLNLFKSSYYEKDIDLRRYDPKDTLKIHPLLLVIAKKFEEGASLQEIIAHSQGIQLTPEESLFRYQQYLFKFDANNDHTMYLYWIILQNKLFHASITPQEDGIPEVSFA